MKRVEIRDRDWEKFFRGMMGFFGILFFVIITLLILGPAHAQVVVPPIQDSPPVPWTDIFNDAVEIIKNWKGVSVWISLAGILTMLTQVAKETVLDGLWAKWDQVDGGRKKKKIVIVVLGQLIGILMAIGKGLKWYEALIAGLLTSGGAVAIFHAFKGDQTSQ